MRRCAQRMACSRPMKFTGRMTMHTWGLHSTAQKLASATSQFKVLTAVTHDEESEGEFSVNRVTTVAQALDVQREVLKQLQHVGPGQKLAGWKIGATNKAAMDRMGLSEPFFGPLRSCNVSRAPAASSGHTHTLQRSQLWNLRGAELEYAFEVGRDVLARPGGRPWCASSILSQVWFIYPAIELVSARVALGAGASAPGAGAGAAGKGGGLTEVPVPCRMADQALHGHAILAPLTYMTPEQWPGFIGRSKGLTDPATCGVRLLVDGQVQATGTGAAVLGDPAAALAWLANALLARGTHLQAGQVVISGTMTGITPLPTPAPASGPGQSTQAAGHANRAQVNGKPVTTVTGEFEGFGSVQVQLR